MLMSHCLSRYELGMLNTSGFGCWEFRKASQSMQGLIRGLEAVDSFWLTCPASPSLVQ